MKNLNDTGNVDVRDLAKECEKLNHLIISEQSTSHTLKDDDIEAYTQLLNKTFEFESKFNWDNTKGFNENFENLITNYSSDAESWIGNILHNINDPDYCKGIDEILKAQIELQAKNTLNKISQSELDKTNDARQSLNDELSKAKNEAVKLQNILDKVNAVLNSDKKLLSDFKATKAAFEQRTDRRQTQQQNKPPKHSGR